MYCVGNNHNTREENDDEHNNSNKIFPNIIREKGATTPSQSPKNYINAYAKVKNFCCSWIPYGMIFPIDVYMYTNDKCNIYDYHSNVHHYFMYIQTTGE